jgi:hypothetical protein
LLGVALIVVPETVIGDPFPLGHETGVGTEIICALLQLSLAGCAKTTLLTIRMESSMKDLIKLQKILSYKLQVVYNDFMGNKTLITIC